MIGTGPMHVEISPRLFSCRVYDDKQDTDYEASCQIFGYGDRGWMYGINGPRFYQAAGKLLDWAEGQGFRILCGYMSEAHARLLRMAVKNSGWTFSDCGKGRMGGRELHWVEIERG